LKITLNTAYGNVVPIEVGNGALLKQYSMQDAMKNWKLWSTSTQKAGNFIFLW